jgi:DNA-binding transcriptional MerR regulator
MCAVSIGSLARRTGTPTATIRYYESIGLVPKADRGAGGQRQYDLSDKTRIDFIKSRRALGFSLADIKTLMETAGPDVAVCAAAKPLAQDQLARVRQQIAALTQVEQDLIKQIADCGPDCGAGGPATCLLVPS